MDWRNSHHSIIWYYQKKTHPKTCHLLSTWDRGSKLF